MNDEHKDIKTSDSNIFLINTIVAYCVALCLRLQDDGHLAAGNWDQNSWSTLFESRRPKPESSQSKQTQSCLANIDNSVLVLMALTNQ